MEMGPPKPGCVKIFDHLDRELTGVNSIQLLMDETTGVYEVTFVHNGQQRSATLVNMDLCNNTTI